MKRAGSALKIVHDKYSKNASLLVRNLLLSQDDRVRQVSRLFFLILPSLTRSWSCTGPQEVFVTEFDEAVKHNEALRSNLSKVQEDMNPIRVLGLFERISKEDCDLLDIHDRCVASRAPKRARCVPTANAVRTFNRSQAGAPDCDAPGGAARLHSPVC
jgi:hypothetical protein